MITFLVKVLIASGAAGGTSKGSIGKYFHLKDFGEALTKFNIDYKLVRETDYVVGFPTKQIRWQNEIFLSFNCIKVTT